MKLDFQTESIKAVPAVGGAIWSTLTLNQCVAIATIIYISLQIAYLVWKWLREASTNAS